MLIEKRSGRRLMNQINVVPYIDVMLVLLVIFMITAPLINPGQIELPQIGKTSNPPVQPLEVSIRSDASLWLRDRSQTALEHKVTRDELLAAIREEDIELPARYPKTWVVDVKSVGSGDKALVYLGRYLYKGVIQEKDIIACKDGLVTFRYQDSKTKKRLTRTLPGPQFLWLILQHVLPKGFRRTRNFGFLHANSKRLLALLRELLRLNPIKFLVERALRPTIKCPCCGGAMRIVKTRMPALFAFGLLAPSG
jgi:biopolymer transport protein ExbD